MYFSTRGNYSKVPAAKAIALGMVPAGGLFVPAELPVISPAELNGLVGKSYQEVAQYILELYLKDYSSAEIAECIAGAYNTAKFGAPEIAPLYQLNANTHILELWHGPTAAFKDLALQIMPFLLTKAIQKVEASREVVILVATSGDTGKAALEGFKDVPGIRIIVFYPHSGVSKVQELQMTTTGGSNTHVVAVQGNFDDCQNAVKQIFGDQGYNDLLNEQGYELSSANSINWGRLLPQIVYYFAAYLRLLERQEIAGGDKINIVVPTGNFGNILAAYYAARMGVPVGRLICASNENRVLTDFFTTGVYDRRREFIKTNSPSMDILISSNLERFLFEITGHDADAVNRWFNDLAEHGVFDVGPQVKTAMDQLIQAGYASEQETMATIRETFVQHSYLLDTHTAVGVKVYEDYRRQTGDNTPAVIAATANPYKFSTAVLEAIKGPQAVAGQDEFDILRELQELSGAEIHPALRDLEKLPVRHNAICDKDTIQAEVSGILGVK